jgi:L-asparagine transporter-like permease
MGLPMFVNAFRESMTFVQITHLFGAFFLLVWGFVALAAPLQIQEYFVRRPDQMSIFFSEVSSNGGNFVKVLSEWTQHDDPEAQGVRRAGKAIKFALGYGVWTLGTLLILYYLLFVVSIIFLTASKSPFLAVLMGFAPFILICIILISIRIRKSRYEVTT